MDIEENSEPNINFIPCLTWVRRGVAKPVPERVKLTADELEAVINQTKNDLADLENNDNSDGEEVTDNKENSDIKKNMNSIYGVEKTEEEIIDEYNLDDYDQEEEAPEGGAKLLGLGDLTSFANPKDDPYLSQMDKDFGDEDEEDKDDFNIRSTDNLILAGHVEGDSSMLEVYVYNDVEDAFYVHHDILLQSFPLALEWLNFDPESDKRGSMVAVGTMEPIIEVWDLDLVDSLEPAYKLGKKGSKKKGITRVGHKDAVLSLSWNSHVGHVLASGSADHVALIWDLTTSQVATRLDCHKEKVQGVSWHPFDHHTLVTGACDSFVRVFDCRTAGQHKKWNVGTGAEVERVLWDHFNPHRVLASTDKGQVVCLDVRQDKKPVWTLSAHNDAVTGLSLSSQCPGCLVTVSQDKTLKVWDVAGDKPEFVAERDLKLGQLHTCVTCPDAPFVTCMGGDKTSDNFKVWDIRESAPVKARFGKRNLQNPLGTAEFGFLTADDAEPEEDMETDAAALVESMTIKEEEKPTTVKTSGGAAGKFKKKNKEKKKKIKNF